MRFETFIKSKDPLQIFIRFSRPVVPVVPEQSIFGKMEAPAAVSAAFLLTAFLYTEACVLCNKNETDILLARVRRDETQRW